MKRLIKRNGLLDPQPAYYAGKSLLTLGLLTVSLTLAFVLDDAWFQLLNAVYLVSIFAPNHKAMPLLERDSEADFSLPLIGSPVGRVERIGLVP